MTANWEPNDVFSSYGVSQLCQRSSTNSNGEETVKITRGGLLRHTNDTCSVVQVGFK